VHILSTVKTSCIHFHVCTCYGPYTDVEHLNTTLNGLCDDYLVFAVIQQHVCCTPMLRVLFHYVNDHQKETSGQKLTLPKKLNIDCNAQHTSHMQPIPPDSLIYANPLTYGGYLHLCIQQQCVHPAYTLQCCSPTTIFSTTSNRNLNGITPRIHHPLAHPLPTPQSF